MASIMELMRELKNLQAARQAGQLAPDQESRLAEIRAILDANMNKSGPGAPVKDRPAGAPAAAPAATQPAVPRPAPQPAPQGMAAGGWQPTGIGFGDEPKGNPNAFQITLDPKLSNQLDAVAAKADAALKANKARAKAKDSDDAIQQLKAIAPTNAYTTTNTAYLQDDYYGVPTGAQLVPDAPVELALLDPRILDMAMLKGVTDAVDGPVIAPGGVFLDDFLDLYTSGVLTTEPIDDGDDQDSPDPNLLIPGKRKVTVHMVNGEVKRGMIARMGRADGGFTLLPQGPGKPEPISMQLVKAVFVNAGATAAAVPAGKNVNVMFKDKRSVQGVCADLGLGPAFTLWPPAGRGGVERIIINQAECLEVR